jgi:glycosyltransferase involved in cell wall biosynthesis
MEQRLNDDDFFRSISDMRFPGAEEDVPVRKIPCSVPLLTLNRRAELERLLPQIVPFFDDVFIMDGNSTDGTQEYARSLGVRIEKQFDTDEPNQRITDFGAMREKLWSAARNDWLFLLDSDEEVGESTINRVRKIVAESDGDQAYTFPVITKLPDGRLVRHALYYPFRYIRVLKRSSGVRLGGRAVHEKFFVPDGVRVIDLAEPIIEPQPSPKEWRARQLKYLQLEVKSMPDAPTWIHFWRWIVWYNLRSLAVQFAKAAICTIRGLVTRQVALPWSYNAIFFEYRIRSMVANGREWSRKRREKNSK